MTSTRTTRPASRPVRHRAARRHRAVLEPPRGGTPGGQLRRLSGWGLRPYLVGLDVLAVLLGAALAGSALLPGSLAARQVLVVLLGTVAVLGARGAYRPRLSLAVLDELPHLLVATATGLAAGGAVLWLLPGTGLSRGVRSLAVAVLLLVPALRAVAYALVRHVRATAPVRHTTLVLGAGAVGIQLARALREHPEYGVDVVGFVDTHPPAHPHVELPAPLLGGHQDLARLIRDRQVRNVMVAFGPTPENELVDVLRTCDRMECEIFLVPRLFELQVVTQDMDHVWGTPLMRVRRAPYRTFAWRVKRVLDLVLALAGLVALSPVLVACAFAVRRETGPGILFRQTRVGLDGRAFELLKFRSLRPVDDTESQTLWNVADDERMGPVGRVLRATSLDELPQLLNVLRGDMSLVGPRPERPYFVSEFQQHIPRYMARHRVPAGLTGYAQVHGLRGDTSIAERARFDNHYIENWSLWGDVTILLRTIGQVLRRAGG